MKGLDLTTVKHGRSYQAWNEGAIKNDERIVTVCHGEVFVGSALSNEHPHAGWKSCFPKALMMFQQVLESSFGDSLTDIVDQLKVIRQVMKGQETLACILFRHEEVAKIGE